MFQALDSRNPETSYINEFIECWLLRELMGISRSFSAHGVAGHSTMTSAGPPAIFGMLWKMNSAELSPTSYSPSRIGRRKGSISGLSVRFSPRADRHKGSKWQRVKGTARRGAVAFATLILCVVLSYRSYCFFLPALSLSTTLPLVSGRGSRVHAS